MENTPIIITVSQPTRLDITLAEAKGISRAQAQRIVRERGVFVNQKKATPHTLVVSSDHVVIGAEILPATENTTETYQITVLYEDNDVLVISKPAGLLVHKANIGDSRQTLVDLAVAHCPQIADVGDNPLRPGIVHRLDRLASGVMILAKNGASFMFLKEQFRARSVQKMYTVLVEGNGLPDHDTITFPIARSIRQKRMAARPTSQTGKEAITHYTVVQPFTTTTLLEAHIETGRTHQIRAHMCAIGHPVVGDVLYGAKDTTKKEPILSRIFLHAQTLMLTLPNGDATTFTSPLPLELAAYLAKLTKSDK
jgi:23S rRNA pseudouridine1911/1915/1917 synthase